MAVGRRANVGTLNLADIGVEFSPRGIVVDGNMQTNVPHVYAVGDVNGLMMLAHAATFQGLNLYASLAQTLAQSLCKVAVEMRQHLFCIFKHRHLAAECAEHRGKFQPDYARTHYA